jgi:hypothetical protein
VELAPVAEGEEKRDREAWIVTLALKLAPTVTVVPADADAPTVPEGVVDAVCELDALITQLPVDITLNVGEAV